MVDVNEILLSSKRILVFSPHPDDAEIIAGGYLYRKASEEKRAVRLIVVTDGSKGYFKLKFKDIIRDIRKREQEESAKRLGIEDLHFLNYVDLQVPPVEILMEAFIRLVRQYKPDLVITVDPTNRYEVHPDHINVGKAVMQAVFFSSLQGVVEYVEALEKSPYLALGATDNPNSYVCLSDEEIYMKLESLRAHMSQFTEDKVQRILEIAKSKGKKYNCKFAEDFRVLTDSDMHLA